MSRLRAFAQLVRLPNVFTALADIGLGALAAATTRPDLEAWFWRSLLCLALASACFYCGGMVLNDYFDIDQDRKERPSRPIPSGRIAPTAALRLYVALLGIALCLAYLSCYHGDEWNGTAIVVAGLLMATIQLYDCWLKPTRLGPIVMGACRFWNVLLGLTLAPSLASGWPIHLASVVGLYIVGVTWFARTEARVSRRSMLRAAALVMLAALAVALPLPLWFPPGTSSVLFPYLLVALGFLVGFPVTRAIAQPQPALVQASVKRSIMGLVVLDATLATVPAGSIGLILLLLLVPALYFGRWIYST